MLTKAELKTFLYLIDRAANELSNNGCNDLRLLTDCKLTRDEAQSIREVCGSAVPEVVGTLNPLFCLGLLLVPAVAGWHNLRRRALLAGLSLSAAFALLTLAGPSLSWVVGWYALATIGEALLSPLGMSHVSAAVPRRLAGTASALWLLSLAVGGKLAGVLGSLPLHTAVTTSILTSLAAALVLWLSLSLRTKENRS